jgi:hypothetical protein
MIEKRKPWLLLTVSLLAYTFFIVVSIIGTGISIDLLVLRPREIMSVKGVESSPLGLRAFRRTGNSHEWEYAIPSEEWERLVEPRCPIQNLPNLANPESHSAEPYCILYEGDLPVLGSRVHTVKRIYIGRTEKSVRLVESIDNRTDE